MISTSSISCPRSVTGCGWQASLFAIVAATFWLASCGSSTGKREQRVRWSQPERWGNRNGWFGWHWRRARHRRFACQWRHDRDGWFNRERGHNWFGRHARRERIRHGWLRNRWNNGSGWISLGRHERRRWRIRLRRADEDRRFEPHDHVQRPVQNVHSPHPDRLHRNLPAVGGVRLSSARWHRRWTGTVVGLGNQVRQRGMYCRLPQFGSRATTRGTSAIAVKSPSRNRLTMFNSRGT